MLEEAMPLANKMDMNRRSLMQNLALLLSAATLPTLAGCKAAMQGTGALDDTQMKVLTAMADTIIPVTDTPGAVAVGVPKLISGMLRDWASPERRTALLAAIDTVGKLGMDSDKKGFADLDPARRKALLIEYDKAALKPGAPRTEKLGAFEAMVAGPPIANPNFIKIKELIINLYYNSEIASTKELIYEHVPGKFVPSMKVTPQTRPFAGLGGPF
jgi:gluconate 2-dehydrogenase gamma chain